MNDMENQTACQVPPHDAAAEKSVIGSLLLDPSRIAAISCKLSPTHFYGEPNHKIYRAMLDLHAKHGDVDTTLILSELKSHSQNGFGWEAYLLEVGQSVAVAAHVERYTDLVIGAARQRRVITATEDALFKARQGKVDEALIALRADMDDIDTPLDVSYRRLTCSELDTGNFELEYLIENTLVAGQPCIIAGGKKCLKTSLILDMGIALAKGGFFLGKLRVNRACRVAIMTGESGLATIQETCRRICDAAGYKLSDISGLVFSEDLPRFGSVAHEDALRQWLMDDEIEVVVLDPAYLCLPGADAGNLFAQGDLLRGMSKVCSDCGCTMILCHHTRKTKVDPFAPPELEDIAWAGFQEFARQWLLVGRREQYEPGTGEHRLWLSVGGSAGHTSLWALDIDEGTREHDGGRWWQVDVMRASEARDEVQDRRDAAKEEQQREQLKRDMRMICDSMVRYPDGETKTVIRDLSGLSTRRFNTALGVLSADNDVTMCEITKPNRKQPYTAYKLNEVTL